MLAKRVVCLLTLSKGQLVRTKNFRIDRWYSLEAYSFKGADEIVVIDVTPDEPDRSATAATIDRIVSEAFVPVTLGGRLRTLDDAKWAFDHGADKLLSSDAPFCEQVAETYGDQAAVWGMTFGRNDNGPAPWRMGEMLCQDVALDGSLAGYGLHDINSKVPVVLGSGCGNADHMIEAFMRGADACATSCILHFGETTLLNFKRRIQAAGFQVRL